MIRRLQNFTFVALAAGVLSGCLSEGTLSLSNVAKPIAVKDITVSGDGPAALAHLVEVDVSGAARATDEKPDAAPSVLDIALSDFKGEKIATGYSAEAAVAAVAKPVGGGKALQVASFREAVAGPDQSRAEAQLAAAISGRIARNFGLGPISQSAPPSAGTPSRSVRPSKPLRGSDGALSDTALKRLMEAASQGETGQGETGERQTPAEAAEKTGSLPGDVPVPDGNCSKDTLSDCPSSSLLSGDYNLRR